MRPTVDRVVVADHAPVVAAVVRTPQRPAIGLLALVGDAVAGLDDRVDPARVRPRHGDRHLPDRMRGKPAAAQPLPGETAVPGHDKTAARPATLPPPGLHL